MQTADVTERNGNLLVSCVECGSMMVLHYLHIWKLPLGLAWTRCPGCGQWTFGAVKFMKDEEGEP